MATASLLVAALAASVACLAAPMPTSSVAETPDDGLSPSEALDSPPPGWSVYRDPDSGFGFWFPAAARLVQAAPGENARIEFSSPVPTNVVEETLTVHAQEATDGCHGPLSLEFDPASLQSEDVELGGTDFVRQSHSGAAAGTAVLRVAYTTWRGSRCVSLDFALSTYDVANLDPTRFPTPPESVDLSSEMQRFEDISATFRWLP